MSDIIGCTFTRGREAVPTVEAGAPARAAGQFDILESCAVRTATSDRVRVTAPASAVTFAVVVYLAPDNAHNGGGMPANGVALDWRVDADDRYTLTYDKGNARWDLAAVQGGSAQNLTLADTFAATAAKVLVIGGDADTLYLGADGGTIATAARAQQPAGLPATLDIGSAAAATQIEAIYGAGAVLDAPISAAAWRTFAALRTERPPLFGEGGTDASMEALWYGAHDVVWTLPATGVCVDLNDIAGGTTFMTQPLRGAGPGPTNHRMVDTPLRDGAIYVDTRGAQRVVTADLMLLSRTDHAALWALRRATASAVNPREGEGVLQYAPGTVPYEIDALLDAPGADFDDMSWGAFARPVSLAFRCALGDWRSPVYVEEAASILGSGMSIPLDIPLDISAAEVSVAAENAGDVPVFPELVMVAGDRGATAPSLENATTGKRFAMTAAFVMAPDEAIVVDMEARTALLEGENAMGTRDPDTVMFPLAPGDNALVAGVAEGNAEVSVRYRPRYVGV